MNLRRQGSESKAKGKRIEDVNILRQSRITAKASHRNILVKWNLDANGITGARRFIKPWLEVPLPEGVSPDDVEVFARRSTADGLILLHDKEYNEVLADEYRRVIPYKAAELGQADAIVQGHLKQQQINGMHERIVYGSYSSQNRQVHNHNNGRAVCGCDSVDSHSLRAQPQH